MDINLTPIVTSLKIPGMLEACIDGDTPHNAPTTNDMEIRLK